MITIKQQDNEQDWHAIREAVFVKEQGFHKEFDDIDSYALHITLYVDGIAAGCGRCFRQGEDYVIGRLAVLAPYRHQKLGSRILQELESAIIAQGGTTVVLDAQCRAIPFYAENGYEVDGEVHMDEHVPHQKMRKQLR